MDVGGRGVGGGVWWGVFFFSSRRRHTRFTSDWSSDVCSSDLQEIKSLHSILNPIETLFIVDSMMGQDAVNAAAEFNNILPLTGSILTKADGDARGGAALTVKYITGKPIKFIGVGERSEDLSLFNPDRIASQILGMGDVLTLIEDIEKKRSEEHTSELQSLVNLVCRLLLEKKK